MAFLLINADSIVVSRMEPPDKGYAPPSGWQVVEADGQEGDHWDGTKCTPVGPTVDDVKAECARRIYAACSAATQANINAYMASMGVGLVARSNDDIALFGKGMQWINDMRAAVPKLVGDRSYQDDDKWPALPDGVADFVARF